SHFGPRTPCVNSRSFTDTLVRTDINIDSEDQEMAQHTTIALVDDLDGSKGSETIQFGIDGQHFEIDLNAKNAKALRKALSDSPVRPCERAARPHPAGPGASGACRALGGGETIPRWPAGRTACRSANCRGSPAAGR